MEKVFRFQSVLQLMHVVHVAVVVKVFDAKSLFDPGNTGFGNRNAVMLLIDDIVFVGFENFAGHFGIDKIQLCGFFGWA